jgi:hypothetical protein
MRLPDVMHPAEYQLIGTARAIAKIVSSPPEQVLQDAISQRQS